MNYFVKFWCFNICEVLFINIVAEEGVKNVKIWLRKSVNILIKGEFQIHILALRYSFTLDKI